jgi:hypothetical protein
MRGSVIGNVPTQHFAEDRHSRYGVPFLASHRALAACSRELARLADEVVRGVAALSAAASADKPTVRRSPDRCIVQLGPVALTIAWLRGAHDAVDAGELLVIVWHGAVAPRTRHQPERPAATPATVGATPLWEQVLTAVGDSEETWAWQPQGDEPMIGRCSSAELATRCVGRLRAAYVEREVPVPLDRDIVAVT